MGHILIDGGRFFRDIADIVALAPIESVALRRDEASRYTLVTRRNGREFATHCANVRFLSISTTASSLKRMVVCGAFHQVEQLDLAYSDLDASSLNEVLSVCAGKLTALSLRDATFDEPESGERYPAWALVLMHANLQQCEVVDLRGCQIDSTVLQMLESAIGPSLLA